MVFVVRRHFASLRVTHTSAVPTGVLPSLLLFEKPPTIRYSSVVVRNEQLRFRMPYEPVRGRMYAVGTMHAALVHAVRYGIATLIEEDR